jgi:iron-sulfur cluster assembly protein
MITLTELAAQKIKENLKVRGKGLGIKVGIRTAGCSGLSYVLEFVDERNSWDDEFKSLGISIFVSPKDLVYVDGLVMDWQKKGLNEGFEFINPNETGKCGCGESFTV